MLALISLTSVGSSVGKIYLTDSGHGVFFLPINRLLAVVNEPRLHRHVTLRTDSCQVQGIRRSDNARSPLPVIALSLVGVLTIVRLSHYCQFYFFLKDPIYLQSVIIHSANCGKGEGWHVEEYSVALLC
jgi:hypothetical protein